jgi:hypothetical protein
MILSPYLVIIIVTVAKGYSVYMNYFSEQEKKNGNIRILMLKLGFKDKGLLKLIVGVVKHVTINELKPVDYQCSNQFCRQQFR